jgi:hypothetical protein
MFRPEEKIWYLLRKIEHPDTFVSPVSTQEFIEFIRDTEPEWYKEPAEGLLLRPLEIHEVRSYA